MSRNCIHTPDFTQISSEMPSTEKKKKIPIVKTKRELEREQQQIGKNHPLQVNLKWSDMVNGLNERGTFL